MIGLGYFILGFVIVFFGGLWWLGKWELFDMYIDDDEDFLLSLVSQFSRKYENYACYTDIPKVLKDRCTIEVIDKTGNTTGYISSDELSVALTKTT